MNVGNPYSAIPEELRLLPNWVLWKLEYPNGPDKKPTKKPYQINGYGAGPINPAHWSTFEACFNVLQLGGYDGLGFVFTNTPYSGIDLDDATLLKDRSGTNPEYQIDTDRQLKVYREFDSYSERSPSGNGCHIIVRGKCPDGKSGGVKYIEIYPSGRFFTMTGDVINNKPIEDRQDMLNILWQQMGGEINKSLAVSSQAETQTDEEILALARKHNAVTFEPLEAAIWIGNYPSQSEADQAYMNIVAYYTNNKEQVVRIYLQSKLAQTDKKRKDKRYLNRTVNEAFNLKLPPIDFDELKEQFKAVSSNGKTAAFDAENVGSIPATVTTLPPGLLGELAQFIYAAAPRPVQEVALAASIGLMAGICGRAYNISGTGLNQYVLLLAMTGAGKEAAASGINKLMNTIKMQVPTSTGFIGPSEISSGSALFKYLGNTSQSFISLLGEFGLRLQQMSSPNANGSEVSLRRMFLDLYNKSGFSEILHASVYSDKANNTSAIPSPSFSILGESTPERFYGALNEDMISEGLLPRFLLIEYKGNRPALNEHHINAAPSFTLIERLASLAAHCESINHSNPRRIIHVQSTPEAAKLLYDFDKYADEKINGSNKEVIRQLWNRAHIKVLKLSALVAVGENMLEPTINVAAMKWAASMVESDIRAIVVRFEEGDIGSNSFELKQANEAKRILKEYLDKDAEYIVKYGGVPSQHKDRVVNNDYLNNRLGRLAAFTKDKSGATLSLRRTMQNLIDAGKVVELKGLDLAKFKTYGKLYFIGPID